jgi:multidrug transporter EmrE-like cation transporter
MKPLAMAGLVLIVLGVGGLVLGRFSYTTKEKVIDMGPITASVDEKHSVDVPDIAGIAAVVAGVVLVYLGRKGA